MSPASWLSAPGTAAVLRATSAPKAVYKAPDGELAAKALPAALWLAVLP